MSTNESVLEEILCCSVYWSAYEPTDKGTNQQASAVGVDRARISSFAAKPSGAQ